MNKTLSFLLPFLMLPAARGDGATAFRAWADTSDQYRFVHHWEARYDAPFGRELGLNWRADPEAEASLTQILETSGVGCDSRLQGFSPVIHPSGVAFAAVERQALARTRPDMPVVVTLRGAYPAAVLTPESMAPYKLPAWKSAHPDARMLTMPPDCLGEALWILFGYRADAIGFHDLQSILDPAWGLSAPADVVRAREGSSFTNPDVRLVLREAMARAGIPLGPLLRAVPERAAEIALLRPSDAPRGVVAGRIPFCAEMFVAANLTPMVLSEEEIARQGVPRTLRVIIAPDCTALGLAARRALTDFQLRGGVLVANANLDPALLPDIDLPMGPDPQRIRRLTADENRAALKTAAREIKTNLTPFVTPYADSDNEDILVHARTYEKADYVFAVNDRRTFGDYVGSWLMQEERAMPNKGEVLVRRFDTRAVYDLIEHRSVPFRLRGGSTAIKVDYTTTDGRIFLVMPHKLRSLKVSRNGPDLVVESLDIDVLIPIKITAAGQEPRYAVVKDGRWRGAYPLVPGMRVRNLADGKEYSLQ